MCCTTWCTHPPLLAQLVITRTVAPPPQEALGAKQRGQDATMTHQQMHATSLYIQQPMQKSHSATPLHHQQLRAKPRTCNHSMHGLTSVLDTSRCECPCKAFEALCASHATECTTKPQTHPKQHATTAAMATARAQHSTTAVCWTPSALTAARGKRTAGRLPITAACWTPVARTAATGSCNSTAGSLAAGCTTR
jgi:hypothetical protein